MTVSSLGNAKSLRGGTLLMTPLKGADGQVYAMAQGNVVVGGAGASASGSQVQINHLSVGRIPAGATVERSVAYRAGRNRQHQSGIAANRFHHRQPRGRMRSTHVSARTLRVPSTAAWSR